MITRGLNLLRVDERYDTAGGTIDANDPWRKKEVSTHKPGSLANLLGKMVYIYNSTNYTDTPSSSYFYAYFYDAVGNLLWTVDDSGYLNYTFSQDAFGNELSVSPFSGTSWSTARTYCTNEHQTGKWIDPFTGLYFFGARWYDSGVGRSCSRIEPPITDENTNPYTFFRGNPLVPANIVVLNTGGYAFIPPPPDIDQIEKNYSCAKYWADFVKMMADTYERIGIITDPPNNPGAGNKWPWVHCMTNCYITKYCEDGTAWEASLVKEFLDLWDCYRNGNLGTCWSAFQLDDIRANNAGREAGRENECCQIGCQDKGFGLGTKEKSLGPFWGFVGWWDRVVFPPYSYCCIPFYSYVISEVIGLKCHDYI